MMKRAITAEFLKARRRHDLPVAALIAAFVLIWAARTSPKTADDLASGYSALYYALPVMNTVVMPVGMAVLASRLWDMETKGESCKLLFTMQSRESLFGAKTLLGLLQNLLICAIEGAGLLVLAKAQGFTEPFSLPQFGWLLLCTFTVNTMLFFSELLLSIRSATQVPALAMGMVGSLLGVFTGFMPEGLSWFIPWGYHVPLMSVRMEWDRESRLTWFYPREYNVALLLLSAALAAALVVLCRRAICRREV